MDKLFTYRCPRCKGLAVSVVYHHRDGRPLCCILCGSYMRFMWEEAITTAEQRAWADRGLVWNPGTSQERGV